MKRLSWSLLKPIRL